ncbi:MAG: substrate-binding domain-containing protein [Lachnospiraceae bacterium]
MIGFNNIRFSWLFTPELTTVIQPITKMGTLAVQIIIKHGQGLPFQKENILDVSLLERQTTKRKE